MCTARTVATNTDDGALNSHWIVVLNIGGDSEYLDQVRIFFGGATLKIMTRSGNREIVKHFVSFEFYFTCAVLLYHWQMKCRFHKINLLLGCVVQNSSKVVSLFVLRCGAHARSNARYAETAHRVELVVQSLRSYVAAQVSFSGCF